MKLNYRYGDWGAQISSLKKGEFYHSSETRSDGTRYMIPSMRTVNASVSTTILRLEIMMQELS